MDAVRDIPFVGRRGKSDSEMKRATVCPSRPGRAAPLILAALIALALLAAAPAGAANPSNVVVNGNLTQSSGGNPAGWQAEGWSSAAGTTSFKWIPGQLEVINHKPNDACWKQHLRLGPGWYRFSAEIRTRNVGAKDIGATLSMLQDWISSTALRGTNDWRPVVFYLKIEAKGAALDLTCRLGGYGSMNSGEMACRDIRGVRVSRPPPNAKYTYHLVTTLAAKTPLPVQPRGKQALILLGVGIVVLLLIFISRRWPAPGGPPPAKARSADDQDGESAAPPAPARATDWRRRSVGARRLRQWGAFCGILALFLAVYVPLNRPTPYRASVALSHSILQGHFYLVDPMIAEATTFHGRRYVAYGVGPSLLMLPFVAIWGLNFNQCFFGSLLAALAVSLWWAILGQLEIYGERRIWLTLLMGLGSPLWFYGAHASGSVWTLMHLTALFGVVLGLWDATGGKRGWVAGLGLGLAVLSRQPVLLSLPFFLGMLWDGDNWGETLRKEGWFAVALGAALAFQGYYDFARFGNPFDNGYARVVGATPWNSWGLFSVKYLRQNLRAYFFNFPARMPKFPWFDPGLWGFSVYISMPAIFLVLAADYRKRVNLLALSAIVAIQGLYLVYYWSGIAQFGDRYSMDYLPFVMLLAAMAVKERRWLRWPLIAVTVAGAVVEIWGIAWFTLHGW
jgi:hypothetical protein